MRNALIVWGGWDGHEPKQCADIFTPFLEKEGFNVTVSNNLDTYLDEDLMSSLHLVIPLWTMDEITREQEELLLSTIRSGCGCAGWHGGMCDSFRKSVEYQFMTGGQWVVHPGGIIKYTVNVTNSTHPITEGLSDFEMESEQYYLHVDPANNVLAETTFKGNQSGITWIKDTVMPQVWTRPYGYGNVFYTALGHVAKDFDVPEAKTIVERGMLWAAREKDKPLKHWDHELHTLD